MEQRQKVKIVLVDLYGLYGLYGLNTLYGYRNDLNIYTFYIITKKW